MFTAAFLQPALNFRQIFPPDGVEGDRHQPQGFLLSLPAQHSPHSSHHGPVHCAHACIIQAAPAIKAADLRLTGKQLSHGLCQLRTVRRGRAYRYCSGALPGKLLLFQPRQAAHGSGVQSANQNDCVKRFQTERTPFLVGQNLRPGVLRQPLGVALGKAGFAAIYNDSMRHTMCPLR